MPRVRLVRKEEEGGSKLSETEEPPDDVELALLSRSFGLGCWRPGKGAVVPAEDEGGVSSSEIGGSRLKEARFFWSTSPPAATSTLPAGGPGFPGA